MPTLRKKVCRRRRKTNAKKRRSSRLKMKGGSEPPIAFVLKITIPYSSIDNDKKEDEVVFLIGDDLTSGNYNKKVTYNVIDGENTDLTISDNGTPWLISKELSFGYQKYEQYMESHPTASIHPVWIYTTSTNVARVRRWIETMKTSTEREIATERSAGRRTLLTYFITALEELELHVIFIHDEELDMIVTNPRARESLDTLYTLPQYYFHSI